MNAGYAHDPSPIDTSCDCYTCRTFSRAYLRHLIVAKEMLAATLVSIHNIQFLVTMMKQSRQSILAGQFSDFAVDFLARYQSSNRKGSV